MAIVKQNPYQYPRGRAVTQYVKCPWKTVMSPTSYVLVQYPRGSFTL